MHTRITIFFVSTVIVTGLVAYRLFNLTFVQHAGLVLTAQSQYYNPSELLSGRGTIYLSDARSGVPKVTVRNRDALFVYSNNRKINASDSDVEALAEILLMDVEKVRERFHIKTTYQLMARNVSEEQARAIKNLGIDGIIVASEVGRFYEDGDDASHVIGFVGFNGSDRVGQYGVESYYDDVLRGDQPGVELFSDKIYAGIAGLLKGGRETREDSSAAAKNDSKDGNDIVLTIDSTIQEFIERILDELIARWSAPSGSIIVQDPDTGAILAMASYPTFDPNRYWEYDFSDFNNPTIQQVYEPGSTFKPITIAGALDRRVITPDSTYYDSGHVTIGEYTISNFDNQSRGIQTMTEILQRSLNTGTVYVQDRMGDDTFLNYVVSFGFGEKTGVDLAGEVAGNISNLYQNSRVNFATSSFGQGIAVTPLQLINAYSSIANGGRLMRPYVVKEVVYADGSRAVTEQEIVDSPITTRTATQLKNMLVQAVDKSKIPAGVPGYDVAAKTGTAQIAAPDGGYIQDAVIHNFVGFAPAYAPKFVVLLKLDRPQPVGYASSSLGPAFADIAAFLLNYFNVPPTG